MSLVEDYDQCHYVKIYDRCIGCGRCADVCPMNVLEMHPWSGNAAGKMVRSARTVDCIGCEKCEGVCPTRYTSIYVY